MGQGAKYLRCGGLARIAAIAGMCLALANCAVVDRFAGKNSKYSPRVVADGEPVPKGGGSYKVGRPYMLNGRTYFPAENPAYRAEGIASWYGADFHGRLTANGEVYDMHSISAAHPTMPLPSYARVTNLRNGRSIIVRVNDRGPYARGRIIDLSTGTAKALGFYGHGLARVRVEYVGRAPMEGSDDRMLLATLRHDRPAPAPSRVMIASAKPFLPDFSDPDRAPGTTPMPAGRPYTLGADARRSADQPAIEVTSVNRPAVRLADRWPAEPASAPPPAGSLAQPARTSPVSAFAPVRDERTLGLMSGRGLY